MIHAVKRELVSAERERAQRLCRSRPTIRLEVYVTSSYVAFSKSDLRLRERKKGLESPQQGSSGIKVPQKPAFHVPAHYHRATFLCRDQLLAWSVSAFSCSLMMRCTLEKVSLLADRVTARWCASTIPHPSKAGSLHSTAQHSKDALARGDGSASSAITRTTCFCCVVTGTHVRSSLDALPLAGKWHFETYSQTVSGKRYCGPHSPQNTSYPSPAAAAARQCMESLKHEKRKNSNKRVATRPKPTSVPSIPCRDVEK